MGKLRGKSKNKERIDQLLVTRGLSDSLKEATALILSGKVVADEQRIDKPSFLVDIEIPIRIKESAPYVSRGGEKLYHALLDLGISELLQGAVVLDFGASTGGFTDCCLQLGAQKVYALDIGTNQLAWKLRNDPRVIVMEQTDIHELAESALADVNFVVADVSFNSLASLLPAICRVVPQRGVKYLVLVKPQFELPRAKVPKGGVVEDEAHRQEALASVKEVFIRLGMSEGGCIDSRLAGRSGNREIFYYAMAML